ncbi:hypothetical protein EI94DRAFT_1801072 [Lactarius quietus]|nr:hypothetical protein EI94DRAFT_1801072 [Lactarius quietus]
MPHCSRFHKAEAKFNVTTEFPHLGLHSAQSLAISASQNMLFPMVNPSTRSSTELPRRYSDKTTRSPSAPIIGTTGSTPLHFAAANGHTPVVLTLLRHGARPDRADKRGVTPELLARHNGWLACADAIRDWVANKDRDLVERETLLGGIPPDDPEPISQCRERHGSLCACEGPECMTTHVMRRLGVKRSIENAMLLFRPGSSLQDGAIAMPDCSWPPPETPDSPSSSRRPSLQPTPTDELPPRRRSHRRSRRPSSAGNGAERNHQSHSHSHSRRLGSKYSLLHIFKKPSSEVLTSHSTPGGATPDRSTGTATSNTASSPTSPLSSSPSVLALELNGVGIDGSPPALPGIHSNGGSFGSSSGSAPPVSISVSRPPQPFHPLHSRSSEPNVSSKSRGKSPGRSPFSTSPGQDGRLSEESEDEDEDEDEEYGVDAPRCSSSSRDEAGEFGDMRGRGDSLSTTLSATTVSTASLRTPAPCLQCSPRLLRTKNHLCLRTSSALRGLDTSSVSSYAQAEALVALARGQVLTAREGDDIPLSARLAALGESLRLERKFREAELGGPGVRSANAVLRIERHVSENTALDSTDAEPWEHHQRVGGKMRSASASAAGRASFDLPPSRRPTTDRNYSADYKVGLSWRGRMPHSHTSDILVSSDNGLLVPPTDHDVHQNRHRSRSAAPAWSESEAPRRSTETRSVRTPIQSPRIARAPSLENLSDTDASPPCSATIILKSAPVVTASPPPFRSRTPDPDYARGAPLSRVVTEPMQDSRCITIRRNHLLRAAAMSGRKPCHVPTSWRRWALRPSRK